MLPEKGGGGVRVKSRVGEGEKVRNIGEYGMFRYETYVLRLS